MLRMDERGDIFISLVQIASICMWSKCWRCLSSTVQAWQNCRPIQALSDNGYMLTSGAVVAVIHFTLLMGLRMMHPHAETALDAYMLRTGEHPT